MFHGADFLHVLLLHAVQPQHLGKALLLGHLAGLDGGGVVAAALGEAGQAGCRADVLVLHVDADGVNALGIVGAGGRADDAEGVVPAGVDAHAHVGGEVKGRMYREAPSEWGTQSLSTSTRVLTAWTKSSTGSWGCTSGRRSPASAGRCSRGGTAGWCYPRSGRPSDPQRSPGRSGTPRRRDPGGRADRDNAGVMPALVRRVVHDKHMIREDLAEASLLSSAGLALGLVVLVILISSIFIAP